jgi:hypothetical protein
LCDIVFWRWTVAAFTVYAWVKTAGRIFFLLSPWAWQLLHRTQHLLGIFLGESAHLIAQKSGTSPDLQLLSRPHAFGQYSWNMTKLLASNVVCFWKFLLNFCKESGLSCVVWMSEFPHYRCRDNLM